METSKYWFINGNFSTAPDGSQQICVIPVHVDCFKTPVAYILSHNKEKKIIPKCLSFIHNPFSNIGVTQITIDFKQVVICAVDRIFSDVKVYCCYFRLCQFIERKI